MGKSGKSKHREKRTNLNIPLACKSGYSEQSVCTTVFKRTLFFICTANKSLIKRRFPVLLPCLVSEMFTDWILFEKEETVGKSSVSMHILKLKTGKLGIQIERAQSRYASI